MDAPALNDLVQEYKSLQRELDELIMVYCDKKKAVFNAIKPHGPFYRVVCTVDGAQAHDHEIDTVEVDISGRRTVAVFFTMAEAQTYMQELENEIERKKTAENSHITLQIQTDERITPHRPHTISRFNVSVQDGYNWCLKCVAVHQIEADVN